MARAPPLSPVYTLIVLWDRPNIPRHLQTTVINALPQLVPISIAKYHLSRANCQKREKRGRRSEKRALKARIHDGEDVGAEESWMNDAEEEAGGVGPKRKTSTSIVEPMPKKSKTSNDNPAVDRSKPGSARPARPEVLDRLVLGINETIKTLERSIDTLKLRLLIVAELLNATHPKSTNLLPTAPRSPPPSPPSVSRSDEQQSLMYILIPLQSISPQSLVSPIPQYCATFNSLVYRHDQLVKVARTRLKDGTWDQGAIEEVRVVPVGRVEVEMAEMVGLRRLACLGIRVSCSG